MHGPGNNQTRGPGRLPPRRVRASALPPSLESPLPGESIPLGVPLRSARFRGCRTRKTIWYGSDWLKSFARYKVSSLSRSKSAANSLPRTFLRSFAPGPVTFLAGSEFGRPRCRFATIRASAPLNTRPAEVPTPRRAERHFHISSCPPCGQFNPVETPSGQAQAPTPPLDRRKRLSHLVSWQVRGPQTHPRQARRLGPT